MKTVEFENIDGWNSARGPSGTTDRFLWLRYRFVDEIPPILAHSNNEQYLFFKVRRIFFTELVRMLEVVLRSDGLQEEMRREIEETAERFTSDEFHNQPLTHPADIELANRIIDKILGANISPKG